MKTSRHFLLWFVVAVISVGCGGSSSGSSESTAQEEGTNRRDINGWEDLSGVALVSGVWEIVNISVDTVVPYPPTWKVKALSPLQRRIKFLAVDDTLVWTYANTPNEFHMEPLTVTATNDDDNTRTFSVIVSNSGFNEAVDDDGSYCYKTPVQRGPVYDAIIPIGTWPWERIIFRHLEGMYLSETTLRNISYD